MKRLLFILSLLVLGGGVYGQDCMPADITLSTQMDINNFQATYGPCNMVTGRLTIDDDLSGDITDLTPLSNITSVGGGLRIDDCPALTSLSGLQNITSVGGSLIIDDCPALTSLSGLDGLISVGGSLNIFDNNALTTCNQLFRLLDNVDDGNPGPGPGPDGIPDVGGEIFITNNLTNGDCENLQDILDAGPAPIPTMSQWSFFLLVLIVFSVGIVGVYNVKKYDFSEA